MVCENALIVFAKQPRPGTVKTRLADSIGPVLASEAYSKMLSLTLAQVSLIEASRYLFLPPGDVLDESLIPPAGFCFYDQDGPDLGVRMARAFDRVFGEGHLRVVLIGSDCPYLTADILNEAFYALEQVDTVFGPAADGGYYLVGLSAPGLDLFSGIAWSTNRVWAMTLEKLKKGGFTHHKLPTLEDIDDLDSYTRWVEHS